MKKTISVLICTLLASTYAHADESQKQPKVVRPVAEQVVLENSSEHLRMDKEWQFNVQLLGVGPSLTSAQGLQFGKFLTEDSLFMGEITGGTSTSDEKYSDKYTIKTGSIGAFYKKFQGNSFYWRVGGDLRSAKVDYSYPTGGITRGFEGTSAAANFQIGNQWQWENFTLGCDWVGVSIPLSHNVKSEYVDSPTSALDTQYNKDDQDILLKKSHLNLLRFYLGASF